MVSVVARAHSGGLGPMLLAAVRSASKAPDHGVRSSVKADAESNLKKNYERPILHFGFDYFTHSVLSDISSITAY